MDLICTNCGSKMIVKDTRIIGGDKYMILFCEKCHFQCARGE